jgi:hypothetical protein
VVVHQPKSASVLNRGWLENARAELMFFLNGFYGKSSNSMVDFPASHV